MARIRTIKPEFPQSESMGRVSRESRLCFILLWTIADDAGRLRGNSRMLASLLYPYDDDAKKYMDKWLSELETEGCIERYEVGGDCYIQVSNWAAHQKIDKPSASKIPGPREDSRKLARIREVSSEDQGEEGTKEGTSLALSELGNREAVPAKAEPFKVSPCPYEEIAKAYAEALPSLPQVATLNDSRKGHISGRWRDVCATDKLDSAAGLEFFQWFFGHVAKSPFLTGKGRPNREGRVWRADLDWLMLPTNFVKVVEGRYHGKEAA